MPNVNTQKAYNYSKT